MPDLLFPSSNRWGIPDLDPDRQADGVPLPVWGWGTRARAVPCSGTWHFFVDDCRFRSVFSDPSLVVGTGAVAAVEPNLSVYDDTPLALALAATYRKRWCAAYWQRAGLSVFVDLNMPARVLDQPEWSSGIPPGWSAYATRGYDRRVEALDVEYAVARRTTDRPLLLVVGGGAATADWCRSHAGAVHSGYTSSRRPYSVQG